MKHIAHEERQRDMELFSNEEIKILMTDLMKKWKSFRADTVAGVRTTKSRCHKGFEIKLLILSVGFNFNLGFYMVELLHNVYSVVLY